MNILRGPNGCPWDKSQSFQDIAPYTIEEAYEVSQAIEDGCPSALRDELGDLLFQVVFHSAIADEKGQFDIHDVCESLVTKMVERHPHVFADEEKVSWEDQKEKERSGRTLDGVALALPALLRAQKLQKRAARVGFDWPDTDGVMDKLIEEIDELKACRSDVAREEELGDILFTVVNLCRHHGIDAELSLRKANQKFETRFRHVEDRLGESLPEASLTELETAWQNAKRLSH